MLLCLELGRLATATTRMLKAHTLRGEASHRPGRSGGARDARGSGFM
jgi:hypothetical protein